MAFCLDDGAELLYGPASVDEPATARLSEFRGSPSAESASESQTRAQFNMTGLEAEPPNRLGDASERQSLSAHRAAEPQEQAARENPTGGQQSGLIRTLGMFGIVAALFVVGYFGYLYFHSNGRITQDSVRFPII